MGIRRALIAAQPSDRGRAARSFGWSVNRRISGKKTQSAMQARDPRRAHSPRPRLTGRTTAGASIPRLAPTRHEWVRRRRRSRRCSPYACRRQCPRRRCGQDPVRSAIDSREPPVIRSRSRLWRNAAPHIAQPCASSLRCSIRPVRCPVRSAEDCSLRKTHCAQAAYHLSRCTVLPQYPRRRPAANGPSVEWRWTAIRR